MAEPILGVTSAMASIRLADDISSLGSTSKTVEVQVSYEVVKLFSEQLYASPVKAIEELVVNSWDAGATVCSVLVDLDADRPLICVFDNGAGMTLQQLEDLWHIGVSHKPKLTARRKQIGKFGIGKLASYAVARRATYISQTSQGLHAVTINFEQFAEATDQATGKSRPVKLDLKLLPGVVTLGKSRAFQAARAVLGTRPASQVLSPDAAWTLVVLEDLKPKAHQLSTPRLRWVLQTAMPLESDFALYLNADLVSSSKAAHEKVVFFTVDKLEEHRLKDLEAKTGESWTRVIGGVKSKSFPSGVIGEVFVTGHSLYAAGGKSEDLGRSHGFFVRVRNRLINETDPLFGARPLSYSTFNRFAAIVEADDLNAFVTAARDDVEQTEIKEKLRHLLIQLFNQARDLYGIALEQAAKASQKNKEGYTDYVGTDLVERPLADALVAEASEFRPDGGVDSLWRLVTPIDDVTELQALVEDLYASERKDWHYTFKYSPAGPLAGIARLDVREGTFFINEDHPLVREFADKPESKRLLEAVIVAEALLEAYLRAAAIEPEIIGDLMERRDSLLRGLALDEMYSLASLARALRDATGDATGLEIALIGALRALGFSARHIAGPGEPDGLAKYLIHGVGEQSFTLEAKSSKEPSLAQLDFAGLRSHFEAHKAQGCLLVAPAYPGANDAEGEVSVRAKQQGVSCWTIDQLARVVERAERRHVNARSLQDIVFRAFAPTDVTVAVEKLMSEPTYDKVDLYVAVIAALSALEGRLRRTPRNISLIAGEISRDAKFPGVEESDVREAVNDLARASGGMLHLSDTDGVVTVIGAIEELRRRVSKLTGQGAPPRRRGTFRSDGAPSDD